MQNTRFTSGVAEVQAHDQLMRYHRAGSGRPVVVLGPARHDALWPELNACLVAAYRVVTPEAPADGGDIARWLGGFLEGIGLDRVTLIASDDFCLPALELVLLGADQVERLILVPTGGALDTGLEGTVATSLDGVPVPFLMLHRRLPVDEAVPLLMQFLPGGRVAKTTG